jgi:hypothetical protein
MTTTSTTTERCPGCDQSWGIYWTGSTPTTDSWACRDCRTEWTITIDPIGTQVPRLAARGLPHDLPKRLPMTRTDHLLQRMLANVSLTDDEQAAVPDGQAALDKLIAQLADVPTPAGSTPREIEVGTTAFRLPSAVVKHGKRPVPTVEHQQGHDPCRTG